MHTIGRCRRASDHHSRNMLGAEIVGHDLSRAQHERFRCVAPQPAFHVRLVAAVFVKRTVRFVFRIVAQAAVEHVAG